MENKAPTPLTLILGLGISGLAMARWCAARGQRVCVADTRAQPPMQQQLLAEVPQAQLVLGQAFTADLLCDALGHVHVAAVYVSPGLSPSETAAVRERAHQSGVYVGSELDLFARELRALHETHAYAPQVLAITGTNGKSTVTVLTGQLLERAGLSVAVAGNIGPSMLDVLEQRRAAAQQATQTAAPQAELPAIGPADGATANCSVPSSFADTMPQVWVLELSSFQLEYANGFAPTAATVLNLSEDHLDWHGSMAAYLQAKTKIFGPATTAVLNRDDVAVFGLQPSLAAHAEPVKGRAAQKATRRIMHFALSQPQHADDWGVETVNGMLWLSRAFTEEGPASGRDRRATTEVFVQRLMPANAMRIRGRHNVSNALAALALASTTGASLAAMLHGLREYRGEPHRAQPIGVVAGVEYIDDSKGTNVGASVAALEGLGQDRKLVVILGGDGKGQDFSPLRAPVMAHARGAVLIGRDAQAIAKALQPLSITLKQAGDLPQAVREASTLAREGDAVLLSPACASLDMFRNYVHRAEVFANAVQELAHETGQALEVWA